MLAISAALFIPSFSDPGPGMDEGILVAYPSLVQQGEVPGRDFETFYGPGVPYLGAAAFEVFGPHVWAERAVGLLFRLIVVAAMFAVLLLWGRWCAVVGALLTALAMLPVGVSAVAWYGALGLALLGVALAARATADERSSGGLLVASGLASGLALAFRPDMALAAIIPATALLLGFGGLRRYAAGLVAGALPVLLWLAVVGPHDIHRMISDLSASRPGRTLPLPSLTSAEGQLLIVLGAVAVALIVSGAIRVVRERLEVAARRPLALGLFCLAIAPAAIERADEAHVFASGCIAIGFAPAAVLELMRPNWRHARVARIGAVALACLCAIAAAHASGPTVKNEVLGLNPRPAPTDVVNQGRSFPISSAAEARDLNHLLPKLDERAAPGDSVFVGPRDLRLTNYNDAFLYYLLPQLRPASYYGELNPGSANAPDSTLADDLRHAGFLLLTTRYDHWDEPNTSTDPGARAPAQVVRSDFCPVSAAGSYELLRRCPAGRR